MTFKLASVAATLTCAMAMAAVNLPAQTASTTESQLIALEDLWVAELEKGDTAALDAILASTYVDTDESGDRTDKQGVLAAFKSGDLKMTSIKLSDMKVYDYGQFAVVTGSADQVGAYKGQKLAPRIIFTDSFVRRNGKWLVVASQRTVPAAQ